VRKGRKARKARKGRKVRKAGKARKGRKGWEGAARGWGVGGKSETFSDRANASRID
jgi:hypothetical protein